MWVADTSRAGWFDEQHLYAVPALPLWYFVVSRFASTVLWLDLDGRANEGVAKETIDYRRGGAKEVEEEDIYKAILYES